MFVCRKLMEPPTIGSNMVCFQSRHFIHDKVNLKALEKWMVQILHGHILGPYYIYPGIPTAMKTMDV